MTLRLVLGPFLISVALTLVRLAGELGHGCDRWFQRAAGGIFPSGVGWILGISWLPVLFGPYFLDRLTKTQSAPSRRVLAFGVLGAALVLFGYWLVLPLVPLPFPRILLVVWAVMASGALLQALGWHPLFQTLLVYGLASRAVVALVMLFAMIGNWGTHYDYVGMGPRFQMPLLPRFLWLAFFPQLVFWVGFTVILGSLAAGIYGLVAQTRRRF